MDAYEFSFGISESLHGSPAAIGRRRHPSSQQRDRFIPSD
jgi:hypothetical protein